MSATTSEQLASEQLASEQLAAGTVTTTAPAVPLVQRIRSIDLMRGIVMIIMTIDHARDYFSPFPYDPTDLSQASPWLFLTRWITHYCAPTFMFLAGTSAFLYARNTGASRGQLQRFLLSRGLWLVFLELTWVSFSWRFDFNGLILQVIWALGWCMVILAGLLYLPRKGIAVVGLLAVFGHNALDGIHAQDFAHNGAVWVALWSALHQFHFFMFDSGYSIALGYPLLPWFGVMALGYCFGDVLMLPPAQRDRRIISLGLSAILLFLLLRLTNLYGEAQLWSANPRGTLYTALGVLNVTKYPPSLLYLLMTLGPVLLLLPLLERARGAWTSRVAVFGKVPMFFYLLHLPLLHLGSYLLWAKLYGVSRQPFGDDPLPADYHPSLLYAYAAWTVVILMLYPLCSWYSSYKSRNKQMWWLSYL